MLEIQVDHRNKRVHELKQVNRSVKNIERKMTQYTPLIELLHGYKPTFGVLNILTDVQMTSSGD